MENGEQTLIHGLEETDARAYVGKGADYYLAKWRGIKNPRKGLSWNLWGFLFGLLWLGYRKMYKAAFMVFGFICLIDIGFALYGQAPYHNVHRNAFSIMGWLGNHFYLAQAKKATEKATAAFQEDAEARRAALAKAGGTSWLGVALVVLLLVAYATASNLFFVHLAQTSFERAGEQLKTGQAAQAVEHLNQALKYNSEHDKAYLVRGVVHADTGEFAKAIQDLDKAVKIAPANDYYYYARATVYTKMNNTDQAIADYTKAIELNPKNFKALIERGNRYVAGGKPDQAIADYTSAVAANAHLALGYYNLGVVYANTGKYKEAADAYRRFVALNPPELAKEVELAKQRLALLEKMRP